MGLSALEATRGCMSQHLGHLQQVDPGLYELAMKNPSGKSGEVFAEEAASTDMQLPHGWEEHVSPEGHAYYHNLVTDTTQWEVPKQDAAVSAGWQLVQAENGGWFYHNPYDNTGVWWPELPT